MAARRGLVRWLALSLLLALGACGGLGAADCSTPVVQLPLELRRNIAIVMASVDGQPARLIVDTGAEHTILLAKFVDRIGLKRDLRHATVIRGVGSAMASAIARPDEIRLGSDTIEQPYVIVGSFGTGDLPGGEPDGLLGADLLSRYNVEIDVPQRRLALYPPCAEASPPWREAFVGLPTRLIRGRFFVPLTLDGVTVPVVVDTGAEYSLVSTRTAAGAGAPPEIVAQDPPAHLAVVGPDPVTAHVHRFRQLTLAGRAYPNPLLPVVPLPPGPLEGLLGMNFLRHHPLYLSYAGQRVFFAATPRL